MTEEKSDYSAKDIKVLEGLEGVRKRPAMYIGSTGKDGLHHLVYEVVDNSVDECLAGVCNTIRVTINKDGSVTVEDNGRGMPVDMHPVYKVSAMEVIVTKLHAGGKFDKQSYAVSGGLHGVGISVVAALSKKMTVEVMKDGKVYAQSYKIGIPLNKAGVIGDCEKGLTGTTVTFMPDDTIFSTTSFDFNTLATRFREICFLNAGLKIIFKDENNGKKEEFHYEGGLVEFVKWLNKSRVVLHKPIYFKKALPEVTAEVSIQYTDGYNEVIHGFVNTINTIEGGTHVAGFKTALTRVINDYSETKGILKKGEKLQGEDVREGVTAIISLRLREPQFEGQTKTKLGNSEIKGQIDSLTTAALAEFFEENPSIASVIAKKASSALKAREAAKKARELVRRKNVLGGSGLPGKLADCSSNKKEQTELYLVEGQSAGGTAKGARDKEFQAILPLKGKILNVEKSNPSKALS
ncbi:MAG: ATP-binding protein, partial [archaeon]